MDTGARKHCAMYCISAFQMTLEQNKTELHREYVMADLRSDITRHFSIAFMELIDQSVCVLQIPLRFPSQLLVSLPYNFVL